VGVAEFDRGDVDAPLADRAARALDRTIIVVLILGIAYFAFDKFVLAPERVAEAEVEAAAKARAEAVAGFYGDRSIAVVPFINLSSDPEQQYLADGIAEEVLNLLARIRELRVISRSSAFALRDENLEVPEIAERLNVAHVLEGSIRQAGNQIRVTAQLIEARSDTHLWSQTYERELGDVFRIQDEIASDVVANLQIELTGDLPSSRKVDPEVLSLTAQAEQLLQTRPDGAGRKMHALLARALEIDPDYIPALDTMVGAYWFLIEEGELTWEESMQKIDATYDLVLELDPDSALPDFYYAFMLSGENKLEEAAALYSRALKRDLTRPDSIRVAGLFATHIGKPDAAVRLLKFALAIDPLCHQCRRDYAVALMYAGDYTNAQWEFERFMTAADEMPQRMVEILLLQGKHDEALEFIESANRGSAEAELALEAGKAMALHSLGRADEAEAVVAELRRSDFQDQRYLTLLLTEVAAWMGNKDLAFENLFAMAESGFQILHRQTFSPIWKNLHDDPHWAEYLEFNGMTSGRSSTRFCPSDVIEPPRQLSNSPDSNVRFAPKIGRSARMDLNDCF
jgi:TolB-like protein/Tfp pilus assembly protein PilF